ncbi:unnamed protein product, partial [Cuscuta epithymum]
MVFCAQRNGRTEITSSDKRPSPTPHGGPDSWPAVFGAEIPLDGQFGVETHTPGIVRSLTWAEIVRLESDRRDGGRGEVSTSVGRIVHSQDKENHLMTKVNETSRNTPPIQATSDDSWELSERFNFFGEEGFDSIKIESKLFRLAARNNEIDIFEIQNSSLKRINFKAEI